MFTLLQEKIGDPQFLAMLLVAIATAATVWTLATPFTEASSLGKRMKAVATERERIRARERERLARAQQRPTLRQEPKAFMRQIVNQFRLGEWLGTETAKQKLVMAGYRGQSAEVAFLFFRLVTPIGMFVAAVFYLFVLKAVDRPFLVLVGITIGAVYFGVKLPEIFLTNNISKRQTSIREAWPDALDLLLICVEAGMSIEAAFRRVSVEIGSQSVPLAEELTLTTAELSYLPDRRVAFENLSNRTGLALQLHVLFAE
jgi:tight adherence protein C